MNIRVRVIKSIEEKLPKIRWWPWRNVRKEIKIEYINIIDRHIFTVFSTDNMEFYLPLRIVDENPGLPEDRVFSYNDKLLIEAEFYPDYLEALNGNEDIVREELKPIIGKPVSASPLSLETTNIVSKLLLDNRDAVVVKSYRLLPKVEMEPLMFKKLALENYKHIPVLHYLYRLKDKTVSLVTRYVEGRGDGGYPFWKACLEYFRNRSSRGGLRIGLAGKLGGIIGELHYLLNKPGDKGFFGAESITGEDIESWIKRLNQRYEEILEVMDNNIAGIDRKRDLEKADFWRQLFEEKGKIVAEYAEKYMKLYQDRVKARIHQDLHLAQMIYVPRGEDFIITDFEGEPGRSPEERLMKEPVFRDVASMIRSFQYLSFMAYREVRGGTIHGIARKLLKNDATWQWRMRHSLSMTLSYISSIINREYLHGIPRGDLTQKYNEYLLPWIIERALYEILYEAMYRPEWVPVPIIGLLNPSIPAYEQVRYK